MTLFQVAPTIGPDPKAEPYVPSHALVLVQFGVPHLLYHQGNDLNCWLDGSTVAETLPYMVGEDVEPALPDGVFVWSGNYRSWQDYFGEWDSELETEDFRPVTPEEWKAFATDEIVWDVEQMRAWLEWSR